MTAVRFVDVVAFSGHPALACDKEPAGTMRLRTDDGFWIDLVFDVNADFQSTGPCDGCGSATLNGTYIGQVCITLSNLFDWEEHPW